MGGDINGFIAEVLEKFPFYYFLFSNEVQAIGNRHRADFFFNFEYPIFEVRKKCCLVYISGITQEK